MDGLGAATRASCLLALLATSGCITPRAVETPDCRPIEPVLAEPTRAPLRDELNVLAMSAGGPWGGFGIGFLVGWSQIEAPAERTRPPFDLAVGVSTGAIIVTHAFLGVEYDATMRAELYDMQTAGVFKRRNLLAAIIGNSVTDTGPLRARLRRLITPELLDRVAAAWTEEGRRLAVIAVDMDCGDPEILDLTALALQRERPDRVERYIDYLMASSASPVAFPPVFVDGRMLVDGALRQHIPLPKQVAQLLEGRTAPGQRVRLHVVINSPLMTLPDCVTDNVLVIALRTSDVWTGERAVDGLALTLVDAAARGWTARFVMPGSAACLPAPPADDYFRPAFMQCQYEHGFRLGSGASSPWHAGLDALPTQDDNGAPHPCATARRRR